VESQPGEGTTVTLVWGSDEIQPQILNRPPRHRVSRQRQHLGGGRLGQQVAVNGGMSMRQNASAGSFNVHTPAARTTAGCVTATTLSPRPARPVIQIRTRLMRSPPRRCDDRGHG
jgi:hypothetical protein